jgi:hypothetical protein
MKTFYVEFFEGSIMEVWGNTNNNKNFGITIIPFDFWNYFFFHVGPLGYNNKRLNFGIGIFSFFFDF